MVLSQINENSRDIEKENKKTSRIDKIVNISLNQLNQ